MFKLLIVEDERITRESLETLIPWNEFGIGEIKSAKNGQEALEIVKTYTPDILLCDVRMPRMDGIEFSRRLKNIFPKCKIVFISGYAEKEYLLSAIRLNAVDYIEKPLDIEKIKSTMKKVVEIIEFERKEEEEKERLKEHYSESIYYAATQLVQQLLKDYTDYSIFQKHAAEHFLTSTLDVIVGFVDWKTEEACSDGIISKEIYKQVLGQDFASRISVLFSFLSQSSFVLICSEKSGIDINKAVNILKEALLQKAEISLMIANSINTSQAKETVESMFKLLKRNVFYNGFGNIYTYEGFVGKREQEVSFDFEKFEEYLKKDEIKKAKEEIEKLYFWLRSNQNIEIEKVKNIFFEMILIAYQVGRQRKITQLLDEAGRSKKWHEIEQKFTLNQLKEVIYETLDEIFDLFTTRVNLNRKVYRIMRFIEENFYDKHLSVQKIANHFYFSPNYLCSMFKKATGKTLNDYITEVRIEKAKQLLKDNSIRLYEIAERVGFGDPNYFSALFKKKVGMTPSEFRERYYV
ncbi:response regulator [Anaerocellum diazotrophicum]|uniref:Stage 0 sporulation protein A homolog n=1 Tax=Caldicellulosiruptor diazotrophicus TaxID=2806205 RepID=A0ABN6E8R4_9FIRM|nr:response regulator [Caldicellulosiruptor diazotrophicus]BCS81893.1 hypothetical protein CaldiYA01_18530 [Caldicellulosiruptor diazotrophicus]